LTTAQVAALLQVSPQTVYRLAKSGRLERIQLGYRQARYTPQSVEALLDPSFVGTRVAEEVTTATATRPD
jgi:excisionase family DNA binding protein